jgi:hypothetical protein
MTAVLQPVALTPAGDLTDELMNSDVWTDGMVQACGLPIVDVPFVAVGGGIGTFVTVDYLRVAGVPVENIRVLSNIRTPWETYEYLTRVSQIPRHERIRSDSSSRPDNLWGFPSYALQEAFGTRRLAPLLQVLIEPVFADYFTPRLGVVLRGIQREAERIRYWDMLERGQVRAVRRRAGGGYFTILTPPPGTSSSRRIVFRSTYVHIAVGYPGVKFLPDLQRFREESREFFRVTNAYEDHEHVYSYLRTRPGTVLVRGAGIVASRILERLMTDRQRYGLQTQIVHLFRTYVNGSHGRHAWLRRRGRHGFAYQGFNYPKSVWGGQLKAKVRRIDGRDRAMVYEDIGGTTTAWRRHWQAAMRRGRNEGWYRTMIGTVERISQRPDGLLVNRIVTPEGTTEVTADFIIDCTGLRADISEHRVLNDLLVHGNAVRNPLGRLEVERSFELRGMHSGPGRVYVSGAATLGGYFPGVDTFLGLQIAAQEIADSLARLGFAKRIGLWRSTWQWLNWIRNKQI